MSTRFRWRMVLILGMLLFGLVSCSSDDTQPADSSTPTPLPTPDALGYQVVVPRACLISEWNSIQSDRRQGNLISWSPDSSTIASLSPSISTTWYTGILTITSGEKFDQSKVLLENIHAAGDLSWSPQGTRLAFLSLRFDESLYTVMVVNLANAEWVDLFPEDAAQSDARASVKSILRWIDEDHLRLLQSCGEDCQQEVDANLITSTLTPLKESERKNTKLEFDRSGSKFLDGLELDEKVLTYDAKEYPRGFSRPNWSPNEKQVMYLDRRGLLWLLDLTNKTQYVLDVGLRVVNETHWSPDGQKVAVRAEDRIYVFETPCQTSPSP